MTHIVNRFWRKVQKSSGCWEWQGHVGKNGYGQLARGRVGQAGAPAAAWGGRGRWSSGGACG